MKLILVFFGFSGYPHVPPPPFPDGKDYRPGFRLVAETLADSLRHLFPGDDVVVRQAWTKDVILSALETAAAPVRQVHIVAHGEETGISLAYFYGDLSRLRTRMEANSRLPGTAEQKAIAALRGDDALLAGLFGRALDRQRVKAIRAKHAVGAGWHLWSCFAGRDIAMFGSQWPPTFPRQMTDYFRRMNFGRPWVPGIAVDIAKSLGVTCTAARGGEGGLVYWHGKPDRSLELFDRYDDRSWSNATKPFWMWNSRGNQLVSYGPDGHQLPRTVIFEQPRDSADIRWGRPPKWMTDLYWL